MKSWPQTRAVWELDTLGDESGVNWGCTRFGITDTKSSKTIVPNGLKIASSQESARLDLGQNDRPLNKDGLLSLISLE